MVQATKKTAYLFASVVGLVIVLLALRVGRAPAGDKPSPEQGAVAGGGHPPREGAITNPISRPAGGGGRPETDVTPTRQPLIPNDALEVEGLVRNEAGDPLSSVPVVLDAMGDPGSTTGWTRLSVESSKGGRYKIYVPRNIANGARRLRIRTDSARLALLAGRVDISGPFSESGREIAADLVCRELGTTLTGSVLTAASNAPISGARVIVDRGSIREASSAKDGTFKLLCDGGAPIRGIMVLADGCVTWHSTTGGEELGVELTEVSKAEERLGPIRLEAGGVALNGVVVDQNGIGLRGVVIGCEQFPSWMAESREGGMFEVPGSPPGTSLRLMFWSSQHAESAVAVRVEAAAAPLRVELKASTTIVGSVCFEDREPVRAGYVMVRTEDGTSSYGRIESDGRFGMSGIQAGPCIVVVSPEGGSECVEEWDSRRSGAMLVTRRKCLELRGFVINRSGQPICDISVAGAYSLGERWVVGVRRHITGEDGGFTLAGVGADLSHLALTSRDGRVYVAIRDDGKYVLDR